MKHISHPYVRGLRSAALAFAVACLLAPATVAGWSTDAPGNALLAETPECQFDDELKALAAELGRDPMRISKWVMEHIDYQAYAYSRKGALGAFFTRRGNSWDQCSLLVALLRISGIPAAYALLAEDDSDSQVVVVRAWVSDACVTGLGGTGACLWVPMVPWANAPAYCVDGCKSNGDLTWPVLVWPFVAEESVRTPLFDGSIPDDLHFTSLGDMVAYLSRDDSKSALDVFEERCLRRLRQASAAGSIGDIVPQVARYPLPVGPLSATLPRFLAGVAEEPDSGLLDRPPEALRAAVTVTLENHADPPQEILAHRLELAAIIGKRVSVDYRYESDQAGPTSWKPVLRVDGAAVAIATQTLSGDDQFRPVFTFSPGDHRRERLYQAAGNMIFLNFDMYGASESVGRRHLAALGNLDPATAVNDAASRDAVLGRIGAYMANAYFLRWQQAQERAYGLHGYTHTPDAPWSFVQIHLDPATVQTDSARSEGGGPDEATTFGLTGEWCIDTQARSGSGYGLFGQGYPDAEALDNIETLTMFQASRNEALVFEDTLSTPSLSTVAVLRTALANEQAVLDIEKTEPDTYCVKQASNGTVTSSCMSGADVCVLLEPGYGTAAGNLLPSQIGDRVVLPDARVTMRFTSRDGGARDVSAYGWIEMETVDGERAYGYLFVPVGVDLLGATYGGASHWATAEPAFADGALSAYVDEGGVFWLVLGDGTVLSAATTAETDFVTASQDYGVFVSAEGEEGAPDTYGSSALVGSPETTCAARCPVGDPVTLQTGEFVAEEKPDISMVTAGPEMGITRTYRSRLAYDGPFGYGWAWSYCERIVQTEIAAGSGYEGNVVHYFDARHTCHTLRRLPGGAWSGPPGADFAATRNPDDKWVITTKGLVTLTFSPDGLLTAKSDANGNSVQLSRSDSDGDRVSRLKETVAGDVLRTLSLKYGSRSGKVERVTDSTGRSVYYVYGSSGPLNSYCSGVSIDAERKALLKAALGTRKPSDLGGPEDLVAFVGLDGEVTLYEYMGKSEVDSLGLPDTMLHNMQRYTLPDRAYLDIAYNHDDTVASHRNAQGGVFSFRYAFLNGYAEVWNEEGWYRKLMWNDRLDITRVAESDKTFSVASYDDHHNPVAVTDGNGNTTVFTYDDRRNITSAQTLDGPSGPDDDGWSIFDHDTQEIVMHGETGESRTAYSAYTGQGRTSRLAFGAEYRGWAYSYNTGVSFFLADTITATDPQGSQTVLHFDDHGNLLTRTEPAVDGVLVRTRYAYNGYGKPTYVVQESSTDGTNWSAVPLTQVATSYDSDLPFLPVTITDPYGGTTSVAYDGEGENRIGLVFRETDPQAYAVHCRYDASGRLTRQSVPTDCAAYADTIPASLWTYDEVGRRRTMQDPAGAFTAWLYHPARDVVNNADVAQVVDALGHGDWRDYDGVGNLIVATDRAGNTTLFEHDGMGRVITRTDALGNTRYCDYDGNGNPIRLTDEGANVWKYSYDHANRRTAETDPDGNCAVYAYDLNGNLVRETRSVADADGDNTSDIITAYDYDARNRLTSKTVFGDADRDGVRDATEESRVWTWEYDAIDRKTKETDPSGHYTRWVYDSDGTDPVSTDDPDNRSYAFTIAAGSPTHNVVALRFEETGISSWKLLSQTVTQYDIRGLVCQVTDPNQEATVFEYDAARRKSAETDPLGTRTDYEYDVVGNLVAVSVTADYGTETAKLLSRTEYTYNLRRDRVAETRCLLDEPGNVTSRRTTALSVDPNGNPEARIDAAGEVWWSHYDALNRPIGSTDPAGASPMRSYDARGNLQYALDALDNLTEYQYDKRNLLAATVDPANCGVEREYDALGRRTRTSILRDAPAAAIATRTDYDAFGAPETVTEAEGIGGNVQSAVDYTRDATGQVTGITAHQDSDPDGPEYMASFTYDGAGRKVTDIDADSTQVTRTYDAAGNQVTETKRDGTVVTRTFDALGRVTSVSANSGLMQEFAYDGLGRLVSATDYNGGAATHTVTYTYNSLSEMTSEVQDTYEVGLAYDQRSAPVALEYPSGAGLAIARDARGLPTSFRYNPNGPGTAGDEVASVTYDLDGRLVGATLGNGIALSREFDPRSLETRRTYADGTTEVLDVATSNYDERGNAQSEAVTGTVAAGARTSRNFEYDERSRLISSTENGGAAWTLDKLGNWTATTQNGGTETRTVNCDNEYKVGVESSCDINGNRASLDGLTFTYDWADRLIAVANGSGTIATYTYDAIGRRVTKTVGGTTTRYVYSGSQVIEEYEGAILARRFVLGPGLDQPILMDKAAGTSAGRYYYLRNRQGSVIALTDAGGAVVESYSYSAFGKPRLSDSSGTEVTPPTSTVGSAFGFAGLRWDAESGLWYCRSRMYSPVLGRFLQRDPAGYVDGVNLYAYCRNNPLAFVDPWGLSAQPGYLRRAWNSVWLGDFGREANALGTGGQIGVGLIPWVGQLADARDTAAAVLGVFERPASGMAWANLGMSGVAWIPGLGDAAKGGWKAGKEVAAEGVQRVAEEAGDRVGREVLQEGEERIARQASEALVSCSVNS